MKYLINSNWLYLDYQPDLNADHNCYKNIKTGARLGDVDALVINHNWRTLDLPHDFCVERELDPSAPPMLGNKRAGEATYLRFFDIPDIGEGESVILEFEGVMGVSDVYFNGTHVKHNRSGYTGFFVDVTDYVVNNKRNTLCVMVDGDGFEGWWYEGAGIYRNVYLHINKPVYTYPLSTFFCPKTDDNGEWTLSAKTTVINNTENEKSVDLTVTLSDADNTVAKTEIKTSVKSGENEIELSVPVSSPALWSPESPYLYTASLSLSVDGEEGSTDTEKIGFRYFTLDCDKGLFLNGSPYKIKGIVCHQDHAGVGVALTEDILRYRLERLKEIGCNGYRSAHHSATPALMRLCDELGMLILDENRHFDTSCDSMEELRSLVLYGRNHPSVFAYSLFNEEPVQASSTGRTIAHRMKKAVLALDDSKFITGAMHTDILTDGSAAEEFTLVGANYQMHLFDDFHKKNPEKNILATENACVFATRGIYETDKEKHFFNEYGDEVASWGMSLEDTWKIVVDRPFVVSAFMWCGFDYRGEPAPFYCMPSISTHWGITDTCGFPKSTYYILKCCYTDTPVVHIIKNYKKTDGGYTLTVISNCDEITLSDGEKAVKATLVAPYRFEYTFEAMPEKLTAKGAKDGRSAEEVYTLPADGRVLKLTHSGNVINVEMTDKNGNLISDSSEISFSVDGGYITGVGNGNPASLEADYAEKRSLFCGKCQMHLRPTADTVTVYATSDKGETATLTYTPTASAEPQLPAKYELYVTTIMTYRNEYNGELCDFVFDSYDMNNYSVATSADPYTEGRHVFALLLNTKDKAWRLRISGVKSPVTLYENGVTTTLTEDSDYTPLGGDVILIDNTCREGVGGFDIPLRIFKKQ